MKEIVKIASLFLAAILLCLSMVSCDSKTNETPTEAHTEHVGAGKCEVCGLDYFDTLVQYIQENGTMGTPPGRDADYKTTYISKYIDGNYYYIYIDENTVNIVCNEESVLTTYNLTLTFTKSTMKYNEWAWKSIAVNLLSLSSVSYEGEMCPEKISPASPIRLDVYNDPSLTSVAPSNAVGLINNFFIPLIAEVGHDLTPSDFGFVRFED